MNISATLARVTDAAMGRLNTVNTTNLRIAVTLGAVILTTLVYLALAIVAVIQKLRGEQGADLVSWEPSLEWLGFLCAMAGVDALQFAAKRLTHKEPPAPEPPAP